jgi:hypothetical protein
MNTKIITAAEARKRTQEHIMNNPDVHWVFENIQKAILEGLYKCSAAVEKPNIAIVESVLKAKGFDYCFRSGCVYHLVDISWDTPTHDEEEEDEDSYF